MSAPPSLYIGLISGTSVDGIDAVLVDFSNERPELLDSHCHPIPQELRDSIATLCNPSITTNEIDLLGEIDNTLGKVFADAALTLLSKTGISAKQVCAIGSHGQTVRHRPGVNGFTLQIADANIIAERTGITTVSDFRRRDMANGGQGAPFAPAFHQAIAPANINCCAFLNLGGIANITVIKNGTLICGYDTGPANGLMDAWIHKTRQLPYDDNGEWASSGIADQTLLEKLYADPYFHEKAPKSTGREHFNLSWLESISGTTLESIAPANVQATLLTLSVKSICNELKQHPSQIVYCCGGGVHNGALIAGIKKEMADTGSKIKDTSALGIAPDWIEAAAFAWLAEKHLSGKAVNLGVVTGARKASVLGMRTGIDSFQ